MKQEITKEQFNELSGQAQERLLQWVHEKQYDPFLTIGQIMEFLDEYGQHRYGIDPLDTEDMPHGWMVKVYAPDVQEGFWYGTANKELCDALWEAVKEVVEQSILVEQLVKDARKPPKVD
jgi:hypothetical protein